MNNLDNQILLIDKPKGITSFDIMRRLKKEYGIKKSGHAGTLDPMATGLMIVATGKKTKELEPYVKLSKVYRAEILIGKSSDTYDAEGEVLETKDTHDLEKKDVEDAVITLNGIQTLAVPIYSAVKIDGRPLYWYARNGKEPREIPVRDMDVKKATMLDFYKREDGTAIVAVRFDVASGVFIRSLAHDLGKRLGYPAMLSALRRTSIGDLKIEDAISI